MIKETQQGAIEIPEYRCHKKVRALQISGAFREPARPSKEGDEVESPPVVLHFTDSRYAPIEVGYQVVSRHWPKEGDYLVFYEDGYQSISPKAAFESGYTLIERGVVSADGKSFV